MQGLSKEELGKLQPHLLSFCNSVRASLAIVKGDQDWKPVYFLAEYDYRSPDRVFKMLFDTPRFRIISGRVGKTEWEAYHHQILHGGKFTLVLQDGNWLTVVFSGWEQRNPCFVTGIESRHGWNRIWPHVQVDFKGGRTIEHDLWMFMRNAAVTYEVPYSSVSEAVSHILDIKEDRLEFRSSEDAHGTILLPIFASFQSVRYERRGEKLHLVATVVYHCKLNPEKLFVSARLQRHDRTIERFHKTRLTGARVVGPEEGLCRCERSTPVEAAAVDVDRATFHLSYEPPDYSPLPIDEDHLRFVPVVTADSEIQRLMTERSDRRGLNYLMKIEKQLLDKKGKDFEEAVFMLLSRMGFDVAWESKDSPVDIIAASPNGCLVVQCTSDQPSVAMARDLKDHAQCYRNAENPRVLPVLATNQSMSSQIHNDVDLARMEQQREVYFLARDRLATLLEELKHESLRRTEKYLVQFAW